MSDQDVAKLQRIIELQERLLESKEVETDQLQEIIGKLKEIDAAKERTILAQEDQIQTGAKTIVLLREMNSLMAAEIKRLTGDPFKPRKRDILSS